MKTRKGLEYRLYIKIAELTSWNSTVKQGLKDTSILQTMRINDMINSQNQCFDLVSDITASIDCDQIIDPNNFLYHQFIESLDLLVQNINFMKYWHKIFPQINNLTMKSNYDNVFIIGGLM